ncbi:hypothetical protein [Pseudonocardia adelaidensis]|uniref:Uncharacterized protein n=1 Tax=Pseudonocardia adelaidensis TaxID=648754 RepID=A0ABP9NUB0_9PSEU
MTLTYGAPPVLGERCVPGCIDPLFDHDGAHYCHVQVGTVELSQNRDVRFEADEARVEVCQEHRSDGALRRRVWIAPYNGGAMDMPIVLTRAEAAQLVGLLVEAFALTEEVTQ